MSCLTGLLSFPSHNCAAAVTEVLFVRQYQPCTQDPQTAASTLHLLHNQSEGLSFKANMLLFDGSDESCNQNSI